MSDLMFITQTGAPRRQHDMTKIRRHVMKDIGKSRRSKKHKSNTKTTYIELDVPENFEYHDDTLSESRDKHGMGIPQINSVVAGAPFNDICSRLHVNEKELAGTVQSVSGITHLQKTITNDQDTIYAPTIERMWTGRIDPFVRYPIEMSHEMLRLVDHIFDDRYGNTPPFRDAWLPVGLNDDATFHQVLSNAALNLAALRGGKDKNLNTNGSVFHHNRAVQIVAKKMTLPELAISDGVISAIACFSCYAHVIGDTVGWHMHWSALKEIIKLRGGIEALNPNVQLRTVLFWAEIGGGVTADATPIFPIPKDIIAADPCSSFPSVVPTAVTDQISRSWLSVFPEQARVIAIINDMRSVTFYLHNEVIRTNGKVYSSGKFAVCTVLPILHRLLKLSSLRKKRLDIVRLSCILFFTEIRRLFGIMGVHPTTQTSKMHFLLRSDLAEWGDLELLKAWCLAMGAIESGGETRRWFMVELEESRQKLGFTNWDELQNQFKEFLWFEETHTPMFEGACDGIDEEINPHSLLGGSRFGGYRPLRGPS